jgi:membrane associated rhomboid family serine protease
MTTMSTRTVLLDDVHEDINEQNDLITQFEQKFISKEIIKTIKSSSFTQKFFCLVLIFNHLIYWFVPNSRDFMCLIPDKTIPNTFWNFISAGYFETNILNLMFNSLMLIFIGKFVEASWDAQEFFKFIILINAVVGLCTFIIMFILYCITRDQYFLFAKISGFHGVIAGLLIALFQLSPDECIAFNMPSWIPSIMHPPQSVRNKHLILMYVSFTLAWCIFRGAEHHQFGIWLFDIIGATVAWTYLRFFQQIKGREGYGDRSPLFAFHMLFPPGVRLMVLKFISTPLYYVFCYRRAREEAILATREESGLSAKSNSVLSKILNYKRVSSTAKAAAALDVEKADDNNNTSGSTLEDSSERRRKKELAERAKNLVEERMKS